MLPAVVGYADDGFGRVEAVLGGVPDGFGQPAVDAGAAEQQRSAAPFLLKDGIVGVADYHPLVAAGIAGVLDGLPVMHHFDKGYVALVYVEEPRLFRVALFPEHQVGELDDGPGGANHHRDKGQQNRKANIHASTRV